MSATATDQNGSATDTPKAEGTYVVLRRLDDPEGSTGGLTGWAELDRVVARNAEAAIREVATKHVAEEEVTYIAIPGKSWKPRPVRRRERVQLVIG